MVGIAAAVEFVTCFVLSGIYRIIFYFGRKVGEHMLNYPHPSHPGCTTEIGLFFGGGTNKEDIVNIVLAYVSVQHLD